MKSLIKKLLREYYDDFGDIDFSELGKKEPSVKKGNNFRLLVKDLGAKPTSGKLNSYVYRVGPSEIFFKTTLKPNIIELDLIKTAPEQLGKGYADKVLASFLSIVDKYKLRVNLSVVPRDKTTSKEGLSKLYSRHGFRFTNDFEMMR